MMQVAFYRRGLMLAALASSALAGIAGGQLGTAAMAQGTSVDVAPVDVTARQRRPAIRPRRAAAPAPSRSARRVAARLGGRQAAGPVTGVQPPISSAQPAGVAPPNAGSAGVGTGERPDGPVQGFVATRSETGTKTNTPRIETPQSISVVGREQIDTLKPQTLLEATRYSPGILSETFGSDTRNDFFLLRGFQAEQTGIFLNALQLPSFGFATFKLEPFGLERIEVLRGPSSVLYGGTNPGGLINAVSKRPAFQALNYLEFGINNYGNGYGAFDFNRAAVSSEYGAFAARITGIGRGGGTQTDLTNDDRLFIAPSFTWRPSEDTSLTVLASYQHDSTKGQNFLPYLGTVQRAPFGFIPTRLFTSDPSLDRFERDQTLVGYEFEHRFDDFITVRQNFRYSNVLIKDQTLFGGGYAATPTFAQANLTRFNFVTTPQARIFNVDNQAELKFTTGPLSHTVLLGLDYKRYSIDDTQGFEFGPSLDLVRPAYSFVGPALSRFRVANVVQDQVGFYAQDQVKFDRFTLVVSGRQDFVTTDTVDKLTPASSSVEVDKAFSSRVGLIYNFDFGLAPYVSYSRSFVPQVGFLGGSTNPLRPEFGEQYEAGIKYQPFGNLGYIGVSFFDLTRRNVATTDPNNFIFTVQAGEIRSQGVEVEAVATLSEGLKLVSAYTTYDFKTTRSLDPAALGKILTNVPDRFGSLFLDYTIQDGPLRGLGAGAGVRYVGHSFADPQNTFKVPERALGDAAIHYERDGWRAAINLTNFTDERYVSGCSSTTACFYGDRRRILGSLSYRW